MIRDAKILNLILFLIHIGTTARLVRIVIVDWSFCLFSNLMILIVRVLSRDYLLLICSSHNNFPKWTFVDELPRAHVTISSLLRMYIVHTYMHTTEIEFMLYDNRIRILISVRSARPPRSSACAFRNTVCVRRRYETYTCCIIDKLIIPISF